MANDIDKTVKLRYVVDDSEAVGALEEINTGMTTVDDTSTELAASIDELSYSINNMGEATVENNEAMQQSVDIHTSAIGTSILAFNQRKNLVRATKWLTTATRGLIALGLGPLALAIGAVVVAFNQWGKAVEDSQVAQERATRRAADMKEIMANMRTPVSWLVKTWNELWPGAWTDMGRVAQRMEEINKQMSQAAINASLGELQIQNLTKAMEDNTKTDEHRLKISEEIVKVKSAAAIEELANAKELFIEEKKIYENRPEATGALERWNAAQTAYYQARLKEEKTIDEAWKKHWAFRQGLIDEATAKELQAEADRENRRLLAEQKAQEDFDKAIERIDRQYREEAILEQQRYLDGEQTYEEYQENLFILEQNRIENTIALYEKLGLDTTALRQQLNDNLITLENGMLDETVEKTKKANEEKKMSWQDLFTSIAASAQNILSTFGEMSDAAAENQLRTLDKVSDERIKAAGVDAEAVARIEEETEKRRIKIERDKAKREKANAIFSILLNTAVGIVKAIPNPVLIALAAATGAAALAVTAARPLPQYEDGGIIPVGGKRHSGGGTKYYGEDGNAVELEQGEGISVLSRAQMAQIANLNREGISGAISSGGGSSSDGLRDSGMTKVYVTETDLSKVGNKVKAIESAATI